MDLINRPLFPPTRLSPPRKPNGVNNVSPGAGAGASEQKSVMLKTLQLSLWIGGIGHAALLQYATLNATLILITISSYLLIATQFMYTSSTNTDDKDWDWDWVFNHNLYFVGNLISWKMLYIAFASYLQTFMISKIIREKKFYPTDYPDYFYWIMGGKSSFLAMYAISIGVLNAAAASCYMGVYEWNAIPNYEACSATDITGQKCTTTHYRLLQFWPFVVAIEGFLHDYYNDCSILHFPRIQMQFTDRYRVAIWKSFEEAWNFTQGFCSFVYFLYLIQGVLAWIYSSAEVLNPFQSPGTTYNLDLWIYTGLWIFVAILSQKLSREMLKLTLSKDFDRPISPRLPESTPEIILADAMKDGELYMKYLAFNQFFVSTTPASRSSTEFLSYYELSHPGGHPKIWRGVLQGVLQQCSGTTQACKEYVKKYQPSLLPKVIQRSQSGGILRTPEKPVTANTEEDPAIVRRRMQMRQLSSPNIAPEPELEDIQFPIRFKVKGNPVPGQRRDPDAPSLIAVFIRSPIVLFRMTRDTIKKKAVEWSRPMIEYVRSKLKEKDMGYELLNALGDYQLLHQGINGILEIVCESPKLDRHGVVQRDLQHILESLVDLHEMTELATLTFQGRVKRTVPRERRNQVENCTDNIIILVCYALSRMHKLFADHYDILDLHPDYQLKISKMAQAENPLLTEYRIHR